MDFKEEPCKAEERRLSSVWIESRFKMSDMTQRPDGMYVLKGDPDGPPVDPMTGDLLPLVSKDAFAELVEVFTEEKPRNWRKGGRGR